MLKPSLLLLILALVPAFAGTPQEIIYTSSLSQMGKPFVGKTTFIFRITNETGSIQYWTSGSTVMAVANGTFQYPLGIQNTGTDDGTFATILWDRITPYVEVTVNGELMLPRMTIPASFRPKSGGEPYKTAMTGHLDMDAATIDELRQSNMVLNTQIQTFGEHAGGLARYARDTQALGKPARAEKRLVFIGDSITESWNLNKSFGRASFKLINRGISGQTTALVLERFRQDALDLDPSAVVLIAGTNDAPRDLKAETILGNLAAMLEMARIAGVRVYAGTIPMLLTEVDYWPTAPDPEQEKKRIATLRRANSMLRQYCAKGACTFVDFYPALSDETGNPSQLYFKDALHPNAEGYARMTQALKAVLSK